MHVPLPVERSSLENVYFIICLCRVLNSGNRDDHVGCICSTLTHGSEAWTLTPRALATFNGFNYGQLQRITGRSYREEATKPSYDLLTAVRTRRHQWVGHILRMPANRLVRCWRWANKLDRPINLAASRWTRPSP